MPFTKVKKEAADVLTLEWILHVKNYKLTLDKKLCIACQMCSLACPKEAIRTQKQPKIQGERAKKAKMNFDLAKCNFCGICDVICPYGAIKVTLNGSHDLSVLAKESFPQLVRDIRVDSSQCQKECVECETACPLSLIKISRIVPELPVFKSYYDGKQFVRNEALPVQVHIDIQKYYCPTCRICEFKCSQGILKVKKTIEGVVAINRAKCPDGCHDCIDVCPIPDAIFTGEGNKVQVNDLFCTYCGACKNVCPVDEALEVKRTKIHHTAIHSGTWNKAIERLTSPKDAVKEFRTEAAEKTHRLVSKRFVLEEKSK